jgi:hypothetical protein
MEPTTQNNTNEAQKTVWVTIGAIVFIVLLIWGGIYMYNHRPETAGGNMNATSSATSTRWNLGEDDRSVTAEERAAVMAYAKAQIGQLSSRKPAVGKSFEVTSVTVEAAGRAIVEYTDGISTYVAAMAYGVDASGNITSNSFEILEK